MKIEEIIVLPPRLEGIDESKIRNTQILNKVLEMISRGDSKETIYELVEFMNTQNLPPITFTLIADK